jgi:hypothetical protein
LYRKVGRLVGELLAGLCSVDATNLAGTCLPSPKIPRGAAAYTIVAYLGTHALIRGMGQARCTDQPGKTRPSELIKIPVTKRALLALGWHFYATRDPVTFPATQPPFCPSITDHTLDTNRPHRAYATLSSTTFCSDQHHPFKMDRQSVFTSRLYLDAPGGSEDSNSSVRTQLETFILDFRLDNIFIYRSAPILLVFGTPI